MSRRILAATIVIVALLSVQALATTYTGPGAADVARRLTTPLPAPADLPPVPGQGGVAALAAAVGPQHAQKILSSGIPNDYAWRVVRLLEAIRTCPSARDDAASLACAEATGDAAAALVRTDGSAFHDINLWPLLYIDGDGENTVYRHDYVVIIDRGGNDLYDNSAGGNLLDHRRGPAGSAAPIVAPAIGCEQVLGNFPAPTASPQGDCIAVPQAVLVDYRAFGSSSNDDYGVFKPPRTVDHNPAAGPRIVDGACTDDPLVRRIVTGGAGFEGNGFLMDVTGDDVYPGKTSSLGAGHVGGVGVLRDLGGGHDHYIAIRNSQGFALAGGVGVLQDDGGDDTYSTYMPRPKDPSAAFQQPGSGGVVDDTGKCDNLPRMVQGTALLGGAGVLIDQGGSDRYQGAPDATQQFDDDRDIQFFHSSQGFGCAAGIGILRDTGRARDKYRKGPSNRADGFSTVEPETTCLPAVPGLGVFSDDGP